MDPKQDLSQLVKEIGEASRAVMRNSIQLKDTIYGPEPATPDGGPKEPPNIVAVLSRALRDLGLANDKLVFMRDSCNIGLVESATNAATARSY